MLITNLAILVLAGFVGFAVISKVPNTLHTPLMSGTNAIHGIVLLGALVVLGTEVLDNAPGGTVNKVLLVIAIAFGTINIVGGFLVTDRMLGMFKSKPEERAERPEEDEGEPEPQESGADEEPQEAEAKDDSEESSAEDKAKEG